MRRRGNSGKAAAAASDSPRAVVPEYTKINCEKGNAVRTAPPQLLQLADHALRQFAVAAVSLKKLLLVLARRIHLWVESTTKTVIRAEIRVGSAQDPAPDRHCRVKFESITHGDASAGFAGVSILFTQDDADTTPCGFTGF